MRQTPAAVMEAGACSWAAMGSARATVTLRGTSARASSARSSPAQSEALEKQTIDQTIPGSKASPPAAPEQAGAALGSICASSAHQMTWCLLSQVQKDLYSRH